MRYIIGYYSTGMDTERHKAAAASIFHRYRRLRTGKGISTGAKGPE